MDIGGAIKSLPRPPSLPFFILLLRVTVLFLAAVNICALIAALYLYSPGNENVDSNDKEANRLHYLELARYYAYGFDDTPQFAISIFLFLAAVYSFLGYSRWSRRVRWATGTALIGCNIVLVGQQFRKMALNGGCETGYIFNARGEGEEAPPDDGLITPMRRRCSIQLVIGSIGVVWSVLLAIELALTDVQRRRQEMDQKVQSHRRAYEDHIRQQQCSTVHFYRPPDVTLPGDNNNECSSSSGQRGDSGTGTGAGAGAGTGARGAGESVELETLPPYQRGHPGPRPIIVDLANNGLVSSPSRSTSRGQPRRMNTTIQTPPPTYHTRF